MNYDVSVPTKTGKTQQVVIRIDHDLFTRIDGLVARLSPEGMAIARSEVLRAALVRGIEALEAQSPPTKETKPPKKSAKK